MDRQKRAAVRDGRRTKGVKDEIALGALDM